MTPPSTRSERARAAVREAAWDLLLDRGLRAVTIEAIAERSGVAKTTIYRHWPTKNAIVLDALRERFEPTVAFGDTGSVLGDLTQQLQAVIGLLATEAGVAYLSLVVESWYDPDLATGLVERYLDRRRTAAIEVVERGVERGELSAGTDAGVLVDALYGALYYRLLVSRQPLPDTYASLLVAQVLDHDRSGSRD